MKNAYTTECFDYGSYPEYLIGKIKSGALIAKTLALYKKLRRFTIVSAVIMTAAFLVALLEKSAILLLLFSYLLFIIPALAALVLLSSLLSVVKYVVSHRKIREWVRSADKITVYMTREKIFGNRRPLFLREAETEASGYDHPVIILSSDRFTAMKWYSLNLLAIKTDYFFILRRFYFREKSQKIEFRVIS